MKNHVSFFILYSILKTKFKLNDLKNLILTLTPLRRV
jgi:hypothetical protein